MEKHQWVMVMSKGAAQQEFGMSMAYSINVFGAKRAIEKAQQFIEEQSNVFRDAQFKLQGGEW